ncbi:hypothetical protein ACFC06_25130 [Nocardia sp. NPDC056064]|uniref:hypothetical protein n=1 Tax=Nocardia sp. NPDC056064 TaxID=3345701 RepID=UPI0035D8C76D
MNEALDIIATALLAGAAAGGQDAASSVVRDSYAGLRNLLRRRTDSSPESAAAIEAAEASTDAGALAAALAEADLDDVIELRSAAEALLANLPSRDRLGQITLNIQGNQIGDGNIQNNHFG